MIHDGGTSLVSSWQIRQLGHERQHFSYLNDVRASAFPPLPTAVNVQNADIQGYETTSKIDVHPPKGRKRGRPASTPTKSNRAQKAAYETGPRKLLMKAVLLAASRFMELEIGRESILAKLPSYRFAWARQSDMLR